MRLDTIQSKQMMSVRSIHSANNVDGEGSEDVTPDLPQSIMCDAIAYYEQATVNDPDKMKLWGYTAQHMHEHLAAARRGLLPLIHHASGDVHISASHRTTSALHGIIAERHIRHLGREGLDINRLPSSICESPLVHPQIVFHRDRRLLSSDFLYRLCIHQHVAKTIPQLSECATLMEIGAGLGQLARTFRLFSPRVTQLIVDLPETLIFSYAFLRANFPDLGHFYCTSAHDISKISEQLGGFVYIPFKLAKHIQGIKIDVAMNTHSFGEMPIPVTQAYFDIIQNQLDLRYLYSLNRYLQDFRLQPTPMVAIHPDARWRTLRWHFNPEFVQTDRPYIPVDAMSTLEVILERTNQPQSFTVHDLGMDYTGEEFLRQQWEEIRLNPTTDALRRYCTFLGEAGVREFPYYFSKLRAIGDKETDLLSPDAVRLYAPTLMRKAKRAVGNKLRRLGLR